MGWTGGTDIFVSVARVLNQEMVSDQAKSKVLGVLMTELQYLDWDTEVEALDVFRDDPLIIEVFRKHDVID